MAQSEYQTASLFTLKNVAATWKDAPPAPDWTRETDKLNRFFDLLIAEGHRQLPAHSPLAVWLASIEERLRRDPYQREKNELVANMLLPLFERNPEHWTTLSYLNLEPGDAGNSLQDYLRNWYRNAPAEQKTFIADVLDLFQMRDVVIAATPGKDPDRGGRQGAGNRRAGRNASGGKAVIDAGDFPAG